MQREEESESGAPVSSGERRRKRRERGAGLSADAIVATAIRIADAEGLEGVSIRRLAAALDARPMSLYDHHESKEALLASMAEEVVAEILLERPLPGHWREALAAHARRMYAVMIGHPWLVAVFTGVPRYGPNTKRQIQQSRDVLSSLQISDDEIWLIVGTVNDYVLGHSLRAVATNPKAQAQMISETEVDGNPGLASLVTSLRSRDSLARFEAGLGLLLDGIERAVEGEDGAAG